MINNNFEDGRRFQRLETQIQAIYEEIYLGSGKDDTTQQTRLKKILEGVFTSYLDLVSQYKISPDEIRRISEIYKKSIDNFNK